MFAAQPDSTLDMSIRFIRLVGIFSLTVSAICLVGVVVLTFGPWAQPSVMRSVLMLSHLAFLATGGVAGSAATVMDAQADRIAGLERLLAERRFPA